MSRFSHLITANTWRYASGWVPDELEIREIGRGTTISEGVDGESKITLDVPVTAPGYHQLVPGKVAALIYHDGTFEEFILTEVTDDGAQSGVGRFTGVGYAAILADAGLVAEDLADGTRHHRFERVDLTATQHLTSTVLALLSSVGITFVDLGDVTVTGVRTIVYDGLNGLESLEAIAAAWGAEYLLRADHPNSRLLLDLVPQRNAGVFGGDLRLGHNASPSRTRSRLEQVNAVTPLLADGSTLAANRWTITAKATNVLTLADPNGGDGPIREDGQLNGLYLESADGTTRVQITATTAATQQVTVTSGTAFIVSDRCRICRTSGGADLTELTSPSSITAYQRRAAPLVLGELAGINNLLPNPLMATYTSPSAAPDGYSAVSTVTFTRTTAAGFTARGGYSARCQTAGDGRGLASPLAPVPVSAVRPFVCGTVSLRVDAGNVRVELVATDGTSTWVFPSSDVQVASPSFRGVLTTMVIPGIDLHALGATSARMRVVQHGATNADFYVDAVQLLVSSTPQEIISEGYDANRAWQAANRHLDLYAPLRVRYQMAVADLARLDGTRYPYDALVLGGTHRTIDPSLGVAEGVRLVARQRTVLVEAETRVTLSNRPEDLISLQARRDPVARTAGNVGEILLPSGARYASNVSMSGSNRANSTGAGFTSGDVGKTIWVFGAGTDGGILKSTITAINTVNQVTMANNFASFGSGLTAIWGTPEDVLTLAAEIGGRRAGATIAGENGVLNPNAKDFQARDVARFFAKPIVSDADTLDTVPDGSTYLKVIPFVTVEAEQDSVNATQVVVDVTALDPTGGADPSISHNGGGSVTGSGPFTIARPAPGDGPRIITFTATKTGRVSQSVTVTAPEQQASGGGTVPPSIPSLYVIEQNNTDDTLTLAFALSEPPSGFTLDLDWRRRSRTSDDGNEGTVTAIGTTSPFVFDLDTHDPDVDLVPKFTTDYLSVSYTFTLRLKDGSTTVATATHTFETYAVVTV